METEKLIPTEEFCVHYNIEYSFINSLQQSGLIEVITVEEKGFIDSDQLQQLEQFVRLHYDLDINLEGIEAISHLLNRVKEMQQQITALKNKLQLYETNTWHSFTE